VLPGAPTAGADPSVIVPEDVAALPLYGAQVRPDQAVTSLRARVDQARSLILGVEELNGTYTPAMANALAWLGPERLAGKSCALVGAAPRDGAVKAMNALALTLGYMGALVVPVPMGLAVPGTLDAKGQGRVADLGKALSRFQ
jgi:NAD(P)H-dependent FMN reductase